MHPSLTKLLQKAGIGTVEELEPEEKVWFEARQKILSKEELTIEDIKTFLLGQISVIETKWRDLKVENSKKAELIPYHTVYKLLLAVMDGPKAAREGLEAELNQLINK
jgi:hypothetical protein